MGVEPERGRPGRAYQVLPVVDRGEGLGISLEEVGDHRIGEPHPRNHGLPPTPDQVDRRRFLVGAHVPREGDQACPGLPLDEFADLLACDRHHVHAHGVLRIELQADEDARPGHVGDNIQELPVLRGALRDLPDLRGVPLDPGRHLPGVDDVACGKDRRPGHPVPHDPHIRTPRPRDERAPAVHRRNKRSLGRRQREVAGPGGVLPVHLERSCNTERHLHCADHVLDVRLHHPVNPDGERPHRRQGGPCLALDERPPHPDRLPRREFLLERIEFEGALFQPPDILIHE